MSEPEKEVTIYDIAKKLNISAATVSRGLKNHPGINKNTKKKILNAASEMGYRSNSFASSLRKKRSNIIGVIIQKLNSNFLSDVLAGIEKVVNDANYNLFIGQSLESMKKEVSNTNAMFNSRVDGLLVSLAYDTTDIKHFEQFINRGIPVIFFDRVHDHSQCPSIFIDNYKAAYEITSHLIEQGCQRLLHISGNLLRSVYKERFRGFKQALSDHNLTFEDEQLIVNDLTAKSGADAAEAILNMNNRPDGVFVSNDLCAISCMQSLKKAGVKIPEDIAFAGFNNDLAGCIIEPNLTTIDYKGYELGEVAARILIGHLDNNDDLKQTRSVILRSELIVRESSLKKQLHL